jgi:hypothetical protein
MKGMKCFPIWHEIVVVDEIYTGNKIRYKETGETLQGFFDRYVKIMREIISEDCLEGNTADKLASFTDLVSEQFQDYIYSVLELQFLQMPKFVSAVDTADKKLY